MNGTPLLRPLLVGALVALAAHAPLSDRAAAQIPATGPFEVAELGVAELQAALLSGSVTCREIVAGYLQRIERYDRPSGLNAITEVHPAALAVADSIDRALAAGQPAAEKPFVDQSRIDFPCHRTVCTFPRDVRAVQPGETDIAVDPRYDRFGAEFQRWQRRESTGLASY
jgi:hypothetical protein